MISLDSIIKGAGYPKPVEEEYLSTFASLPYEEEIEIYQAKLAPDLRMVSERSLDTAGTPYP